MYKETIYRMKEMDSDKSGQCEKKKLNFFLPQPLKEALKPKMYPLYAS